MITIALFILLLSTMVFQAYRIKRINEGFDSLAYSIKFLDKTETYACTQSFQAVSFNKPESDWISELIPKVNAVIAKYYPGADNSRPWILGMIEAPLPDFAQVYDNEKIILSSDLFDKYFGWDCQMEKILLYMRLGILYGNTEFLRMPWQADTRDWKYSVRYANCSAFIAAEPRESTLI